MAPGGCQLAVKVIPNAPQSRIVGWSQGDKPELIVKVKAPPREGKANEALVALLAREAGVARSAVSIARGANAHHKMLSLNMDTQRFEQWQSSIGAAS
jgi:uncharacterized protein (TIGR00251 family)